MAESVAQPLVAALLVNYRGAEMTLQCVADLFAVEDVTLRIAVLDNGSGEAEVHRLREGILVMDDGQHQAEVISLGENFGFTGGINRGLALEQVQDAPYVLVLNNDMRLPKDFVRPLVDVLRNDPSVGVVGPTVVHSDGTVWAEGGEIGFTPNGLRLLRHGKQPSDRSGGPEEVGFLTGACMLLRRDAFVDVGGFDDDYFMYWEDVDLSDRLRSGGHRVVWLPWVRVEHFGGQSSGGGRSPLRKFLMACNAVRYLKARGTLKGWSGWLLFDVLLWPITCLMGPRAAWAKLLGTVAGLRGHRAGASDVERLLARKP